MRSGGLKAGFTLGDELLASGIVACTFFYFLIFAQFALLHRIEELDAEKTWLQPVMLLMGMGGLLGSIAGWKVLSVVRLKALLAAGFLLCGGLAFLAGFVERIEVFLVIGFGVGVFLGMLTVVVVPALRLLVPPEKIGRWAGLGTGVAYFGGNVPAIFDQSASVQGWLAGAVTVLGSLIAVAIPKQIDAGRLGLKEATERRTNKGFWSLVALFFVLVWLDSAAFYAIQESDTMRVETWGDDSQLWSNGLVHLVFGVLSGFLLEKGWVRIVLGGSVSLLVAGCLCLRPGYDGAEWMGARLYVAGVSLYSTALVATMAMQGEVEGSWTIAKRAAILFGLAGWVASGIGIGMARDLGTVPVAFLAISSGAAVFLLLLGRKIGEVL